ncbi:MAG: flagellar hook-basal body complex protein FliE [Chromatiales bacterium]|nr:flagellar hook-basal body complex protein FliE [Chromatiales bacterium]
MIQLERAKLSFEARFVQVRNKLLDACQDILRMRDLAVMDPAIGMKMHDE